MKIVYAADNRLGAAYQVADFIAHSCDEVRVAAYPKSGRFLSHIDWNLDAVKNNTKNCSLLRQDIQKYYPDLVIVDAEPIVANIADQLDLPIIYCSPLHLLDGLNWPKDYRRYSAVLTRIRQKLIKLPAGVAKFISSPWGDFSNSLLIKNGFEWIQPYHMKSEITSGCNSMVVIDNSIRKKDFNNILSYCGLTMFEDYILSDSYQECLNQTCYFLMDGQTRHLSDALYNNKSPIIFPEAKDGETLLNALLADNLTIGTNLDQIELIGREAVDKIKQVLSFPPNTRYHQHHSRKQLHERINELWECT